jgi:hypothetical protein
MFSGILCSVVSGCWDLAKVRAYGQAIEREAMLAVRREGCLKLLANVIDRSFASSEAASELRRMVRTMAAATPGSRIALLVGSSLMKRQTGVELGDGVRAFQSEHAARVWLTAYDPIRRQPGG